MAEFDRSIPPGGEGKITLRVSTKGYHGNLLKRARVFSNDKTRSVQTISIKASVKNPINITPRYVFFKGRLGQKLESVVQITAGEEKPLIIKPDQFDLKNIVSFEIKQTEEGKKYQLLFTANPKVPGFFQGALKLTTNYPEKPDITILIKGRVQKQLQKVKPKKN